MMYEITLRTWDDHKKEMVSEVVVGFCPVPGKTGEQTLLEPHVSVKNPAQNVDLVFKMKPDEYSGVESFFKQVAKFTNPGELVDICKNVLGGLFMSNPGSVLGGLFKREKK
ncbi:MAG: hypothetical protein Q8R29_03205 [bacterium]|nr:hypothetical protein [bacterium]